MTTAVVLSYIIHIQQFIYQNFISPVEVQNRNLVQRESVGTLQSRTEICLSIRVVDFYFLILHC